MEHFCSYCWITKRIILICNRKLWNSILSVPVIVPICFPLASWPNHSGGYHFGLFFGFMSLSIAAFECRSWLPVPSWLEYRPELKLYNYFYLLPTAPKKLELNLNAHHFSCCQYFGTYHQKILSPQWCVHYISHVVLRISSSIMLSLFWAFVFTINVYDLQ